MSNKDRVVYFASRFRAVQYRVPSWSDRNFRNSFYAALAPRIRPQFVTAGRAPPPALDDLIAATEGFDRAYWTDIELNRSLHDNHQSSSQTASNNNAGKSKPSNNSNSSSTLPTSVPPPKPENKHLGPDGKLTPEER